MRLAALIKYAVSNVSQIHLCDHKNLYEKQRRVQKYSESISCCVNATLIDC